MNDQYIEEGVRCRDTSKNMLVRLGMVAAVLFSVMLAMVLPFLIILPFIMIAITVFVFSRLHAEFEYIYADGQIDFDRIRGNAKRKTLLRVDLDQAEIVAPTKSNEIMAYQHGDRIKVRDFSSFAPDAKTYSMIVNKGGNKMKIIFEPSERLVKSMKRKHPRKVVEY